MQQPCNLKNKCFPSKIAIQTCHTMCTRFSPAFSDRLFYYTEGAPTTDIYHTRTFPCPSFTLTARPPDKKYARLGPAEKLERPSERENRSQTREENVFFTPYSLSYSSIFFLRRFTLENFAYISPVLA